MADFLQETLEKASTNLKKIVLPEGEDQRILQAAKTIAEQSIAKLVILGDPDETRSSLEKLRVDTEAFEYLDPESSEKAEQYAEAFYQLRKHKGITASQAESIIKDHIYFATMMVKTGDADGFVAGAAHSTAETIRPALQIIKTAPDIKTVSSMIFVCLDNDTYVFADCALVEDPDAEQLADIAVSTAQTAKQFGIQPRVAMLSFSTKGSAKGGGADKVVKATEIAKEKFAAKFGDEAIIDGELQFDAAFVPEVAKSKCPDSPIQGRANVFIFPDLGAGNITYKAVQRLAGAEAYGPVLQGLAKPVNDLSRGCSVHEIVATVALTAIQAQQ